jgi:transcriptional regulator with XRE-family HTH domain
MDIIIADCEPVATGNCNINLWHYCNVDIKQEFSKRLLSACKNHWNTDKPKQTDMAKAFGVSQATVSEWMNGIKMPGLEKLIEICFVLNVCLEWLGTGRGPMKPPCSQKQSVLTEEQKIILRKITDLVCD